MKAIVVTCPHCGGRLSVPEARETVTCEYCGTASRIQRRTRMLERVIPPPSALVAGRPRPIAVQHHSSGWVVVIGLLIPLLLVGGIIGTVMYIAKRARSHVSALTDNIAHGGATADAPTWQGTESVIPVTTNNTPLLIGRSRRLGGSDEVRVVAIDANTGKAKWESERLGNYSDTYQGMVAIAGDLVLYTSPRAEVRAFALADGKPRWSTKLPERVTAFCEGTEIIALGADDELRALRRADGKPTTAEVPPAASAIPLGRGRKGKSPCKQLPSDRRPNYTRADWDIARKLDVNGDTLAVGAGGRVVSGTRSKGTQVPTFVAIDDAGKARWRVDVPADPLGSIARAPQHVVVGPRQVCGAYHTDSVAKPEHAVCFAMADGKRLWDFELSAHSPLSAFVVSGNLLLISMWSTLEARDLDTGVLRWKYGR